LASIYHYCSKNDPRCSEPSEKIAVAELSIS